MNEIKIRFSEDCNDAPHELVEELRKLGVEMLLKRFRAELVYERRIGGPTAEKKVGFAAFAANPNPLKPSVPMENV